MNPELEVTLDEAVNEVLSLLTGLDLSYEPELDRYRVITRALNRALRLNALESEWSWYASEMSLGTVVKGDIELAVPTRQRPRIIGDDALRLVDSDGRPKVWAYFLPRDALHKYAFKNGLWCAVVKQRIHLSRPISAHEGGLEAVIPVMREPVMFRLPPTGEEVPDSVRNQRLDFSYPDLVIARAAYLYAQTDPVMQPRVPTLEDVYKNFQYQVIERDTTNTDMPYLNEFIVPVESELRSENYNAHRHPHA